MDEIFDLKFQSCRACMAFRRACFAHRARITVALTAFTRSARVATRARITFKLL